MGIADYGVSQNGEYQYSTHSFLGRAQVNSLSVQNASGYPWVTFQLNSILRFVSHSGQPYVYWVQNVAEFDTAHDQIYIVDNVWNQSASHASLSVTGIIGSGLVSNCNCTDNANFYYDQASSSLPGSESFLSLPFDLQLKVNSSISARGQPMVEFAYNDGFGWQQYDSVTFIGARNVSSDSGFLVDGYEYNPYGTFYDAEWILGGPGGGENTSDVQSSTQLELQFWNGHNYESVPNAYNFGSNTAEGIQNVDSAFTHNVGNGAVQSNVTAAAGKLGALYYQSQLGELNFQTQLPSGSLRLSNSSLPLANSTMVEFSGNVANVTIFPGTYRYSLYAANGTAEAVGNASVSAGQVFSKYLSFSSKVPLLLSYASEETPPYPPTITYLLGGQSITANLQAIPSTFYVDQGSQWNITSEISASPGERWITNDTTASVANSPQTIVLHFYHQYSVNFSYSVQGGGKPVPILYLVSFGKTIQVAASSKPMFVWIDAGSLLAFSQNVAGTSGERWQASGSPNVTISSSQVISPVYFHQYLVSVRFTMLQQGNSSISLPTLRLDQSGNPVAVRPNATLWVDAGSRYVVPEIIGVTGLGERWEYAAGAPPNGTIQSTAPLNFSFVHQYFVTIHSALSSQGIVSPATGWYNASSSLSLQETSSSGWGSGGWQGSGQGAYTGSEGNHTLSVEGSIVENALFMPTVTLDAGESGSIAYSYGNYSGVVAPGSQVILNLPLGTRISLTANPSAFIYSLQNWGGNASGSSISMAQTITAPETISARFGYNFDNLSLLLVIPLLIAAAGIAIFFTRRKRTLGASLR